MYDLLFNAKIEGIKDLPQNVDFSTNDEKYYQNINKWIKGYYNDRDNCWVLGVIDSKKRVECIRYLSRLAFYNSLRQVKITRFYLNCDEKAWKTLHIDDIPYTKNNDNKFPQIEFYKEIKWIFDDLSFHPPIYHFIYSQLLSSDLLPGTFNNENKEKIIKILNSLWFYTKDMVTGIKELAKNIREHANPPIGAITGRIYKEEKWIELKKNVEGDENVFDTYLTSLKENKNSEIPFSFFDFNVIDLGKEGVIETLKKKTKELTESEYLNETVKKLISDDMEALNNNEICFRHFLDPSLGNTLNQQSKKAIAHLGLLIFSNLINENFGIIRASTSNCIPFIIFQNNTLVDSNPVAWGTNYHIVLPISKNKEIKTLLPHPLNVPLESSLIEIKGIEELLDYELINIKPNEIAASLAYNKNSKCIFRIYFGQLELINNENEIKLWNDLTIYIKKHRNLFIQNTNFVCIDFENTEINESQIFRFLGIWNLQYSNVNLIIINITTNVLNELIKVNEYFLERLKRISTNSSDNDNATYWNAHSLILIYSHCSPRQNEQRFYFTDILWGKERHDFYHINKLIKKTNFNASTLLLQNSNEKEYDSNRLTSIAQSGFFHSRTTLLPFDLLLNGKEGLTLFEHNASVLLQNELNLQENNNCTND